MPVIAPAGGFLDLGEPACDDVALLVEAALGATATVDRLAPSTAHLALSAENRTPRDVPAPLGAIGHVRCDSGA
jgi:hypothetical protein